MGQYIAQLLSFIAENGEAIRYYAAQIIGILIIIGVIVIMQMKKKKQMLIISVVVNFLSAVNVLLLSGFSSGVVVCCVAVLQLLISIRHEIKKTEVGIAEKIIFLILYVGGGISGIRGVWDILTVIAALFYMLAVFQKKEQNIRLMMLVNHSTWAAYYAIIGSTAVLSQVAGLISSLVALFRYRKSKKIAE